MEILVVMVLALLLDHLVTSGLPDYEVLRIKEAQPDMVPITQ